MTPTKTHCINDSLDQCLTAPMTHCTSDSPAALITCSLATLLQEIATAEGKKAALEMSARAVREEHEDLQKELETVQLSVEAAKADVTTAQRELRTLRDKVGRLLYSLVTLSFPYTCAHTSIPCLFWETARPHGGHGDLAISVTAGLPGQ